MYAFILTLRAQMMLKKRVKFSWEPDARQFEVSDYSQDFWPLPRRFADRLQGFISYRDGFEARALEMSEAYSLKEIDFANGDVVVDCGANYGDLELALAYLGISGMSYYAFEPDPSAFASLAFNSKSDHLYNCGLWETDGTSIFYVAGHADSSFIKPPNATTEIEVQHLRLDRALLRSGREQSGKMRVRLLKIEAEGAEPEVIRGAPRTLKETGNVAVDAGRERGLNQDSTLVEVTNLLNDSGFKMKRLSSRRLAVLFSKG
jgi:FkbM family methyltransferase